MNDTRDCIMVGGGIAGLQAAIQLGRYQAHRILVIDSGGGRSALCRGYHNLLGWPDGISGADLRRIGRRQAEQYGAEFVEDRVIRAERTQSGGFAVTGQSGETYRSRTLVLATGVTDRFPEWPGFRECFGKTAYVCPDCDGYEIIGRRTVVLGSGNPGASMALLLAKRGPSSLHYLNHERKPVSDALKRRLTDQGIAYAEEPVAEVELRQEGTIAAVRLAGGSRIEAERAFVAFGGNEVHSELAAQLGAERLENGHVLTHARSKMTNVPGLWCIGDVGVHSEQAAIAMGEGVQAAIWIHKVLMGEEYGM